MKQSKTYTLHYSKAGSGPILVMLHGFLSSSQYWEKMSLQLQENYTVVTIDLLGFGLSPKPRHSTYDYKDHIASINHTLEIADVSGPFTLVGHSMGSLLSLRYANLYPDRVENLYLLNMPIMLSEDEVKAEIFKSRVIRLGLHPATQGIMWGVFKLSLRLHLLPRQLRMMIIERAPFMFQHTGRSRLRSFNNVIVKAQLEADLETVKMKTTVISGLSDRAIYMKNLSKLSFKPNIKIENLQGAHHLPLTKSTELVRIISAGS